MRKHLSTIILGIVLLAGLSLLLYPTISDYWNSYHQSKAIAGYVQAVDNLDDEKRQKMLEAAQEYNEKLLSNDDRYHMTDEQREEYESLLDVSGNGIMAYIEIPSLNITIPIYHGTDKEILQIGIGHMREHHFRLADMEHTVLYPDTEDLHLQSFLQILIRWLRGMYL